MSIILKGIDLPKEDQVIVIHSNGTFNLVDPTARVLMPLYEAIQIPEDHGRLIDADKLKANYTDDDDVYTPWLRKDIDDAPTILEAEE